MIENLKFKDMKPLIWCNLKHLAFCERLIISARLLSQILPFSSIAARNLMNTRLFLLIYFLMVLLCDRVEMGVNHNIIKGASAWLKEKTEQVIKANIDSRLQNAD